MHKPNNKNKYSETCKHDMLIEKVEQGNKAICEGIQNLTSQTASLHQTPRSQTMRASEQPSQSYQQQPRTANSKQCQQCQLSNLMESAVTVISVAAQNTGQQVVIPKTFLPLQIKLKPCFILQKRRTKWICSI